jgi:hypothetical protein
VVSLPVGDGRSAEVRAAIRARGAARGVNLVGRDAGVVHDGVRRRGLAGDCGPFDGLG